MNNEVSLWMTREVHYLESVGTVFYEIEMVSLTVENLQEFFRRVSEK